MKLLRELLVILSLFFIGEVISKVFHLPVPGNILGMIFLLCGLCFGIIKTVHVENITKFLLDHMAFFFIPAGVGLITSMSILKDTWYKILIVCVVSTIVVMAVTGKTIDFLIKMKEDKQ